MRLKGQYNEELTRSPRLDVKPLITAIRPTAIQYSIGRGLREGAALGGGERDN